MSVFTESNQNPCDYCATVMPTLKVLKSQTVDHIDDCRLKIWDEKQERKAKNLRLMLREFIERLSENIDVLMAIMEDLTRQHNQQQLDFVEIEKVITIQQKAIDKVQHENKNTELKVNEDIQEIREEFIRKWKELDCCRRQFQDIEVELNESCEQVNQLESKLALAKIQHRRNLCAIKAIRKSKKQSVVTMEMIDTLRQKEEKYAKKLKDDHSYIECLASKTCQVQCEIEVVRKVAISNLRVVKIHDEWSTRQLVERKTLLELDSCDGDSQDEVIDELRKKIKLAVTDISAANETVKNLQTLVDEALEKESPCARSIKPLRKPKPVTVKCNDLKEEQDLLLKTPGAIIAKDYIGSTFIKLT